MDLKIVPLLLGIVFIILRYFDYYVGIGWIILCFILSGIFYYISIHRKNKERRTPQAVYLTENY